MGWFLIAAAILAEVTGTVALRQSDGFSRLVPSVVVVAGYAASFYLLGRTLRHLPLSVTYAVWAGVGTALVALVGVVALGESVTAYRVAGVLLIIGGVAVLQLGGSG